MEHWGNAPPNRMYMQKSETKQKQTKNLSLVFDLYKQPIKNLTPLNIH